MDLNKKQVELELELPAQKIITKSFLPLISIEENLANKMVEAPGDYEGMVLENIKIAKFQSTTSLEVTLVDNASVDIKEGEIINAIFDKVHDHDPFVCNLTLAGGLQSGFLEMSYFGVKHGHFRAFLGQKRDFRTFLGQNI